MQLMNRVAQATTVSGLAAWLTIALAPAAALAQPGQGRVWASDPRADDRTYRFADTDEAMPYCVFSSSKISDNTPAPLIISLHGLGAPPQIMCNQPANLAELSEQDVMNVLAMVRAEFFGQHSR
jgi:hypothetical protein